MTKLRVLLVDDDSPLLQTLADYLSTTLFAIVYTATSVPAALSEIEKHGPFDVLVCDYELPPHTAHDLEEHLRASQDRTPLVIHSGFAHIDEPRFQQETYRGLVSKPGHREVAQKILELFPEAKQR